MLRVPRMNTNKHFDSLSRITVKAGFRICQKELLLKLEFDRIFHNNHFFKTIKSTRALLFRRRTSPLTNPAANRKERKRFLLKSLVRVKHFLISYNSFNISGSFSCTQSSLSLHSIATIFLPYKNPVRTLTDEETLKEGKVGNGCTFSMIE